jgi:acyl carrier protein
MKSLYTAAIASTVEERVAAYCLRYSVYIEEQKKQYSEADHERRWLTDRLDANSAIVIGKTSAVLCGTVRASFLDSEVVKQTYDEQLGLSLFARVEPKAIAICSRLAVLRLHRATPVSSVIFSELYRYGSERGTQLCFVACASGLRSFFLQYGFREYLPPFPDHVVGTLHRMVLALDDLEHLERINSPYLPTARLLRVESVSRPWLEDILEDQKKRDTPSPDILLPDERILKTAPTDDLAHDCALIEKTELHYRKSSVIKDVCAIRVGADSNRLHAVVVPDFKRLKAKRIVNVGEIIRFEIDTLSAELPPVNRISSYDIWQQELPKNCEGQLDRAKIRRQVEEYRSETSADRGTTSKREPNAQEAAWLSDPYVRRVLHVVQTSTNIKNRVHLPDDNIEFDLKLDSLGRVELLAALESELGVRMRQEAVASAYTLGELVDAVRHGEYVEKTESGWKALFDHEPPTEYVREFSRERRLSRIFWFAVGRLVRLSALLFFQLEVMGEEHLPDSGAFLLCPNHQSFLDPPVVLSCLPWRVHKNLFMVGTSEIFGKGLAARIARTARLFPIDPDTQLVPALQLAAYGLNRGLTLLIYPEGERSVDGSPKLFKKGAAILATYLNVPLYPVALDGFFEAWPRGRGFRKFSRLKITFGSPIYPKDIKTDEGTAAPEAINFELRSRVVEMWEELHYRKLRNDNQGRERSTE